MNYYDDYMELLESLPMDIRERFTEMRQLDLQLQNALEPLEERISTFFGKCNQPAVDPHWKLQQHHRLRDEFQRLQDCADEKISIANQMRELLSRFQRKLEQELTKYKLELEADNAGNYFACIIN